MTTDPSFFSIWSAGLRLGIRSLRRDPFLGIKRLALPVSYWRTAEFRYVWKQLQVPPGSRVLDLGSPKELAPMLAHHRQLDLLSADLLPREVGISERYSRAGATGRGAGRLRAEVQDGRSLSYESGSFDAAFSVSVLEHIPERGDTDAIRELIRVVRPGGSVIVTVPYDRYYRETFLYGTVYDRVQTADEPVFYQRHYDGDSLQERLLRAGDVCVTDLEIWGESRVRMDDILTGLGKARIPLHPVEAFLSAAFLRRLEPYGNAHPMAAFFTLQKQ